MAGRCSQTPHQAEAALPCKGPAHGPSAAFRTTGTDASQGRHFSPVAAEDRPCGTLSQEGAGKPAAGG